jgi:hypothetical protein
MKHILLLEDLPEIRAWLRTLVLQVFPGSSITEAARVHDALQQVQRSALTWRWWTWACPMVPASTWCQAARQCSPRRSRWWSPSTTTTTTSSRRCRPAPTATSSRSSRAS